MVRQAEITWPWPRNNTDRVDGCALSHVGIQVIQSKSSPVGAGTGRLKIDWEWIVNWSTWWKKAWKANPRDNVQLDVMQVMFHYLPCNICEVYKCQVKTDWFQEWENIHIYIQGQNIQIHFSSGPCGEGFKIQKGESLWTNKHSTVDLC